MGAGLLLIPLILIRYGLLSLLNSNALKRAAFFAPLEANEKPALWLYQGSNLFLLVYLCFLTITAKPVLLYAGLFVYWLGIALCLWSILSFAKPLESGINTNGFYRFSRNPMYLAYFFYYLGCVLLTQSLVLLVFLMIFQISAHWIILSEERWCIKAFGHEYINYMKKVRRYI
ncbi:MAG TPA: methyltransferase [Clostridia bacterium]|nr:methyltransferase [Clostridia bacterium]